VNIASLNFTLALFLVGCGRQDQSHVSLADGKLHDALAGTWLREGKGMINLASDGSFSSRWTNLNITYEGTWAVTGGDCVTLTASHSLGATNRKAVGATELWRIITVDDRKLVWEWINQTQTFTLIREK